MTAVGIDTINHWSEYQHKHHTQYAIYNDSIFGGSANAFFCFIFSRRQQKMKKKTFFAIIRIQRLNESWKRELKVFPLSAFMYAHSRGMDTLGRGHHICGHISNKPAFVKSVSCCWCRWCWWHFFREFCVSPRQKTGTYTWKCISRWVRARWHTHARICTLITIPKVTLMA